MKLVITENQGNLAQFWGGHPSRSAKSFERMHALEDLGIHAPAPDWENGCMLRASDWDEAQFHSERNGAGLLKCVQQAHEAGIYSMFLYTDCLPEWSRQLEGVGGASYLGYDLAKIFTFRLEEEHLAEGDKSTLTLKKIADDLVRRVREEVARRKENGWGYIHATSANFYIDYEIAGGADIPMIEDFAFSHLNIASSLSRGLCKQYSLPTWGAHLAHEHYSWLPYSSRYKFPLFRAAFFISICEEQKSSSMKAETGIYKHRSAKTHRCLRPRE